MRDQVLEVSGISRLPASLWDGRWVCESHFFVSGRFEGYFRGFENFIPDQPLSFITRVLILLSLACLRARLSST